MMQVGGSTLISRFFGVFREILMVQYLGAGIISDAFITAFKIPNSLRKIFAEGAMSVALVPTLVALIKNNKRNEVNSLMTLSFLIFQGILLALCALIFFKAEAVIHIIAPGWYTKTPVAVSLFNISWLDDIASSIATAFAYAAPTPQIEYAVTFLRILISFIIFLSSSALLAGALQSVNHFFVPAFGQVLMNIILIIGLSIGLAQQLPVTYFCYVILFAGFAQFVMHLITYFYLHFSFESINATTWQNMKQVFEKFLPCLLSMSVMEINLFIATSLGSFLQTGSISLIYYANRFMGIPLGIFATAFATVLLPHFARVNTYAPQRLSFYLYEAAKFIVWVTVPASLFLSFIAEKLFYTLYANKLSVEQVTQASWILIAFLSGLFFFSLNKILLNLYYAQHNTRIPLLISIAVTAANFMLSYFWLMPRYGAVGIALAMTFTTGMIQCLLASIGLIHYFNFKWYIKRFGIFMARFAAQLIATIVVFLTCYQVCIFLFAQSSAQWQQFFIDGYGFWIWIFPLAIGCAYFLFTTRRYFGIKLYFLE